jgi:hypothetical protein
MDIGRLFTHAWEKFSANIVMAIVVYLVGMIVGSVLSSLTLGIAGVPVFVGTVKAMRRVQRGEAPDFNDLFSEFSRFSNWIMLWVLMLVIGVCIWVLGWFTHGVGSIVVSLLSGFATFFVIPLMLERNMPAMEALKDNIKKIKENTGTLFLPILIVLIVMGIFPPITGPLMTVAMWDIYDEAYK